MGLDVACASTIVAVIAVVGVQQRRERKNTDHRIRCPEVTSNNNRHEDDV